MKELLDRLGFYDFLGIWGPGAIAVTYYIFTLPTFLQRTLGFLGVSNPEILSGNMLVILYTAVAYMVGVVLHELGKLLCDHLFNLTPQKCRLAADYLVSSPIPAKGIRREYKNTIEATFLKEIYDETPFEKAISYLKYGHKSGKKKYESYHAFYALARSLSLTFSIHAVLEIVWLFMGDGCCKGALCVFLIDLALAVLFAVRTRRYCYAWVKNVYVQYYLLYVKEPYKLVQRKSANIDSATNEACK